MAKKLIPGLFTSILKGAPLLMDLVKPFIKKKPISDEQLTSMSPTALVDLVKQHQSKDDEPIWQWILKRATTAATVYFIIWAAKQLGVTYADIMSLFGLIK